MKGSLSDLSIYYTVFSLKRIDPMGGELDYLALQGATDEVLVGEKHNDSYT